MTEVEQRLIALCILLHQLHHVGGTLIQRSRIPTGDETSQFTALNDLLSLEACLFRQRGSVSSAR